MQGPYAQVPGAFGKLKSALIDVGLIHVSERNTWVMSEKSSSSRLSMYLLLKLLSRRWVWYAAAVAHSPVCSTCKPVLHNHGCRIRCLGVYLDDPNTTPAAQCRAYVAWVFKHGEQVAKPEGEDIQLMRWQMAKKRRGCWAQVATQAWPSRPSFLPQTLPGMALCNSRLASN
jgi:hypothetical protein